MFSLFFWQEISRQSLCLSSGTIFEHIKENLFIYIVTASLENIFQHCCIFHPSYSPVSKEAGIEHLTVRASKMHLSHTKLHLIHRRILVKHLWLNFIYDSGLLSSTKTSFHPLAATSRLQYRLHCILSWLHLIHSRLRLVHSSFHLDPS